MNKSFIKRKKILLYLLPTIIAPNLIISAGCTLNSTNKWSKKNIHNNPVVDKIEKYLDLINKARINLSFEYDNNVLYDKSLDMTLSKNQENIAQICDMMDMIIGSSQTGIINSDNVELNTLMKEVESAVNFKDKLSFFTSQSGKDKFYQFFDKMLYLALDVNAQIFNDSRLLDGLTEDDENQQQRSRFYILKHKYFEKNKQILNEDWETVLSTDYKSISNIIANLHPKAWKEKGNQELVSNYSSSSNNSGHNHSHAIGNMIYELYNVILTLRKEIKENFEKDVLVIEEELKKSGHKKLAEIWEKAKNDFTNFINKIQDDNFLNAGFNYAEDAKRRCQEAVNVLQEITRYTIGKSKIKDIFVAIDLADGTKLE
ncbi:MAG5150 family histidine triad lipoprotein [Mycoplasmopsis fermentans]|uniref:Lipoprotein n=2 Tax=Mycoplasmopsis fermentans TaxID=2115 RepID=C4XEU8_MYCFP|nr:hypothetical protein [Mycoplasmopsis fermentans]VEU66681.1 Uncharacterised protein [Mesomycoplasma conjunctivae]ADN68978.1 hypothetical membrane associated protein [Mycoplasmopsis fermentans JER]ADV34484.1 Hypothetical Protein MfeM64YM_0486 [Mycoplasmopsis fermentans M64]VEU64042.1 Uncharacterised protein [Mycoplasmopsis fermentans]BAH69670.1 hypothetical protein MBIO_0405 [Mycoplasmopsis fermentans PG18]